MSIQKKIIIFYYYLHSFLLLALPVSEAKEILSRSKLKFDDGHYMQALKKLSLLDIRKDLDDYDDIKKAYEIIIISYWQTNKIDKSKESMRELLLMDEKAVLEGFTTPPLLLEAFREEQKKINEKKIATMSSIQSQVPLTNNSILKNTQGLSSMFLPLGGNLYSLKQNNKALVYLILQSSFLGMNIGAFWWKQTYLSKFNHNDLRKNEYKQSFNTTQIIQFTALAAFLLSYGISVGDALVQYYN